MFLAIPDSVAWLQSADDNTVQWQHYQQCLLDHANYLLASGVPVEQIHNPYTFAEPGDLQTLQNVVSDWPRDAPANQRAPTLYMLLQGMHIQGGVSAGNFNDQLEWYINRNTQWLIDNRRDPNNPNETREERNARLNRERVARHRLRHAAGSDDPVEHDLIQRAKAAEESASQGRKWLKGAIQQEKVQCTADIAARKAQRDKTIESYTQAVVDAERQAADAKRVLDEYRINK
jgi:hypothetical protein